MNWSQYFRIAINGLNANKLRSALTMLGIIFGVASVVALLSVGRGVENFVVGEFEGLGSNLLFVTSKLPQQLLPNLQNAREQGGQVLTNSDVERISDPLLAPDVVSVVPEYGQTARIVNGRYETQTSVVGTTANYPDVRNFHPVFGTFFTGQDIVSSTRVAVLGQTAYKNLFPDNENPLQQTIRINNLNFHVIGILEEKGSSGLNDRDDIVLIPLSTAQRRLFPARRPDGEFRINLIYAEVASEARQQAAVTEIEAILRQNHDLAPDEENDFSVLSQTELVRSFSQIIDILTLFLLIIAGISLLVGGIGIMNIMLVSVTERTQEIGLRKAVGAKQRDILVQFLLEALMISIAGGLTGLLLGIVSARGLSLVSDSLSSAIDWTAVFLALSISISVGLLFGVYPARRAARLNPIEALRHE